MDRNEIQKILPHRGEMLLLDELNRLDDGRVSARYCIRKDAWFLRGHFPGRAIVPGVILCECMAQACCGLDVPQDRGLPYLVRIEKAVFRRPVVPGETLLLRCRLVRPLPPFYTVECEAAVGGHLCAQATMQLTRADQSREEKKAYV